MIDSEKMCDLQETNSENNIDFFISSSEVRNTGLLNLVKIKKKNNDDSMNESDIKERKFRINKNKE